MGNSEKNGSGGSEAVNGDQYRVERLRNALSGVLMSVLIGVAFQEMVAPVRESIRIAGFTWGTSLIAVIFFLTSMRFFIGNQLHLLNENLLSMKGLVWFYDLVMITLQTVILVFLGGVSSFEATKAAKVSFVEMLIYLYLVDILWIFSQWLFGIIFGPSWKRKNIPWGWAILNLILVICLVVLQYFTEEIYSGVGLLLLASINIIAFMVDVFLLDYFDVFENLVKTEKNTGE